VRLFWNESLNGGRDIHVLKGETSPSLLDLLGIADDATPPNLSLASSPPADVDPASVRFRPNFVMPASDISINTATGAVTIASPRPAPPRLQSFVLEATVTTKPPAAKTLGPIPIRVCVHDSIRDFWLTPSLLTVRKNADGQRFTVLAEFDDGTIGDITIGDITGRPGFAWATVKAADSGKVIFDPGSGTMEVTVPSGTFDIKATHAGLTRKAKLKAEKPWSTPIAATLVPGSAGVAKMAKVPNILFLPDGFTAAEKPKFEALVKKIVSKLQSTPALRPFDLLKGAVNYFMAFVPSRERGCSALYDMTLVGRKPLFGAEIADKARHFIIPVKPAAGATFTLANLIYEVGLPATGDDKVPVVSARSKWALLYGLSVSLGFSDAVYLDWQNLHDHRLANERDTAFGLANGQRPTMDGPKVPRAVVFNPRRTTFEHLVDLLQNLRLKTVSGPMIGTIWAKQNAAGTVPAPSNPALPAGLKVGQDLGRIFVLVGGARYGGAGTTDEFVAMSLGDRPDIGLKVTAGSKQVDLVPFALPSTPSIETLARIAHETCHAFGLGDEYGEFEAPLRIPTSKEGELTAFGNVQPASVLAKSAADPSLDPAKLDKIKWLWPRVDAAGVLAALPVPSGTPPLTFNIKLQPGHAAAFAPLDVVRLRKRPLIDHPTPSGRLVVAGVSGDIVTVTVVPFFTNITPADWPVGSVLIRPVRGEATLKDPFGPDLLLVAQIILDQLGASKLPLNLARPKTGAPITACVKDENPKQKPKNLPPAGLARPRRYQSQIVGLYDGGYHYFCGVYHPSGVCLLRQLLIPEDARKKVPELTFPAYNLCPVCRYVIVDRFDPTKHAVIDKDLEKRYPVPKP
jgi:hypothetical protein